MQKSLFNKEFRSLLKSENIKNFLTLFSGSVFAQIVSLIVYPIVTRQYSPENFGTFSLFMNIAMFLVPLSTGKYEQAILLPRSNKKAVHLIYLSIIFLLIFVVVLQIITFLVPANNLFNDNSIGFWIKLIPFYILMVGLYDISINYLNRDEKYRKIARADVVQSSLNSGIKIAVGFTSLKFYGLIGSRLISILGVTLTIFIPLQKEIKKIKFNINTLRYVLKKYVAFPQFKMVHYLINTLSAGLPIFLFSYYFSLADSGYFSLATGIIHTPILLLTGAISKVLYKQVTAKTHNHQDIYPMIKRIILNLLAISVIPFTVIFLWGADIATFIFGQGWTQAGIFMQYLSPWYFLLFIISPFSFLPDLFFNQRKAMLIELIFVILRGLFLSIGIYYNNILLSVKLYALISSIFMFVFFIYYISLIKKYNTLLQNNYGKQHKKT